MVTLEFAHIPNGETRTEGPFEFVQFTYNSCRVGSEGDRFIADFDTHDGFWEHEDGSRWTDLIIATVTP